MRRTLLLTLEYPPQKGGVAAYYYNLAQQLPKDAIHVLMNGEADDTRNGVTVAPFFSHSVWPKWLPAVRLTMRTIRKHSIKHLWVGQILPLGTIALIINKLIGIPYTVSTHGMDLTIVPKKSRKGWLLKQVLKNAHSGTANSAFTAKQAVDRGATHGLVYTIFPCPHNTPDAPRTILEEKPEGQFAILCVARLVRRKGADKLIETMPAIIKENPNTVLWLVGKGEDAKHLQELASQSSAKEQIRFWGCVSDAELCGLYSQADLFAMPSRTLKNQDVEGFGIVYLEANMFNLPVIGGLSGGVEDAVINGQTGYLVNGEDIDAISERILYLIHHADQRELLGTLAKKRAKSQFQWAVQAETLKRLFS